LSTPPINLARRTLGNQINNTILVTGAVGFTAMGMGAVVKSLMIIGIDKGRGFGGGLMGGA
jgi:hypothetical protein